MDLLSADRSYDSEFTKGLQEYNAGVHQHNINITKDIDNDRDTEKNQDRDVDSAETFTQIKDAIGEGSALGQAGATFTKMANYKKPNVAGKPAGKTPEQQVSQETEQAGEEATEEISAPTTETPPSQSGGILSGEAETGGGALSSPEEAGELLAKGKSLPAGLSEGDEAVSLVSKVGSKALKGLGVLGAVGTLGMDIASDTGGGFSKMSTADKIGNVVSIGGAGLDILGAGLEATGVGVPFGLALQAFGTVAQIGAGIESSVSSKEGVKPQKDANKQEEQAKEDAEDKPMQEVSSVSVAGTGGLGVSREQQ